MRRRRTELAYVCLLPAVPKAWRATLALTHCPAVEPLRWGLRGIGGSAIVLGSFFRYLLPTELKIALNRSAIFSPNSIATPLFRKELLFFSALSNLFFLQFNPLPFFNFANPFLVIDVN
jgi:hypothetical protein